MIRDLGHDGLLGGIHEGNGQTLTAEAAAAANAVHVVLLVLKGWQLEVEDHGHTLHVNAAGQQISRNQEARLAVAEILHTLLADRLCHWLTIDHTRWKAALRQNRVEALGPLLGVHEQNGLGDCHALGNVAETVDLPGIVLHWHNVLVNAIQGHIGRLQRNAHRLLQDLVGQVLDLIGHGRREQSHLAPNGKTQIHNLTHLVGEAVTQHLIGLIQNEVAEMGEGQIATGGEVEDAARCADYDLGTGSEVADILVPGMTADGLNNGQTHVAG